MAIMGRVPTRQNAEASKSFQNPKIALLKDSWTGNEKLKT